jgi:hypothetical protein
VPKGARFAMPEFVPFAEDWSMRLMCSLRGASARVVKERSAFSRDWRCCEWVGCDGDQRKGASMKERSLGFRLRAEVRCLTYHSKVGHLAWLMIER